MAKIEGSALLKSGSSEFLGLFRGKYNNLWVGAWAIPSLDPSVAEAMGIPAQYRAVGVVTSRASAVSVCVAADEALKTTNARLVQLDMTTDCFGQGPRCAFLVFGAENVSDARKAALNTLNALPNTFGGMGLSDHAGYDVHWSANPGEVLCHPYFGAVPGKAWGFLDGWPKAVGLLMADAALKTASVELVHVHTTDENYWHNEFTCSIAGGSGEVLAAVRKARETAEQCIHATGDMIPKSQGNPYY